MDFDIKKRLQNYSRVLKIAKKPDLEEFSDSVKICFVGLVVVGIIGFLVYILSIATPLG